MYRGTSCQFMNFLGGHPQEKDNNPPIMTRSSGEPIPNYRTVSTVGPRGPPLMEDHIFLEDIQHVGRGRIPERVVHAKGTGAHGYFEVTHDISKYCAAKVFAEVGKKTPIFTRFSVGASQLGAADTITRGIRGMGIKFYSEEGNWDLGCLSEPVLIVDDPMLFFGSSTAGTFDPQTNLRDLTRLWDFATQTPEATHFLIITHSDRGIPDGYRFANYFAINNFKFINQHGETVFVRFTLSSDQGIRNLTQARATQLAGSNPDYASEDLIQAIERGDYPSFTMSIQVMTTEQAQQLDYNPFNVTKIWSHKKFPLLPVGKLVLNRNMQNHWDESEQSVFYPGNFVPGIRAAEGDKSLAGRILVYRDAQVYRLGVNHNQYPINRPINPVANYQREGKGVYISQGSAPHYFPNSFGGPVESQRAQELEPSYKACDEIRRYEEKDPDHFSQPRDFYKNVLDDDHRSRLITNLAASIRLTTKTVQESAIKLWANVDQELSERLREAIENPPPSE